MIALFCILIVLGLTRCDHLPSRIEVESSINRTINEVERLIRQNLTLPHLTRREIVDILFNITSKDLETYKNKETIEEAREIYQRALMVVLPYNAEDAKESMKDLYTKPPIVEIIADAFPNQKDFEAWRSEKLQPNTSTQEMRHDKQPLENLIVINASEKISSKENSPVKTQYKNHRETYSEVHSKVPLKETLKLDSAPIKFSFNLDNLQKQSTTTEKSETTTRRPIYQGSSSAKDEEVYIVYSTSATTVRTVETSPRDILTINLKKSQMTSRPLNYNENVLHADQWRYNAPTSDTQNLTTSIKALNSSFKGIRDKRPFLPTVPISLGDILAPTMMSKIKDTTEIPKVTSEKMQVETAEKLAPIYVTPASSSSSSSSSEKSKYTSTYSFNSGGFRRITTTTTTMRPEVMELLASIGLRPENTKNVEEVFEKNKENLGNKSEVANNNGFVYKTSGLTAIVPDSPSIIAQNTFENPVSEIGKGMNNLTPEVQLLFQRFGLQTSNPAITTTSTPRPTVNTNSYTNFKPLLMSKVKNQDMKEFLAKFGLDVNDNRQKKAMPASTERPSLIEVVPSNMRQILENIGLVSRKIPKTTLKVEDIQPTEMTKFHVFKPHEVRVKDEGQRMKINQLLDTIRLVQEGKADAKDVRKVADDLIVTTKTLKDGPDPLSLEEIIRIYNRDVKNEVKRQQNLEEIVETTINSDQDLTNITTTSTESVDVSSTMISTTTTTTMVTPTTSRDSAKDGSDFLDTLMPTSELSTSTGTNLMALEESFGGTTRAPDPILPTKPRSGLYFLLDWNTFLEVGEEDSEKVNLRFQPKIGDKTRFLPVSVP